MFHQVNGGNFHDTRAPYVRYWLLRDAERWRADGFTGVSTSDPIRSFDRVYNVIIEHFVAEGPVSAPSGK